MAANLEQIEMLGGTVSVLSPATQEDIAHACRDRHDALIKSFLHSGLDQKEVYLPLGMSQTQFSLFLNRKAYIPHEKEHRFASVCGNRIALRFDAWKAGYALTPILTTLEAENVEIKKQLEAERAFSKRLLARV